MKFKIKYALGGGFGGIRFADCEEIEADSLEDAEKEARFKALEEYESYEGTQGIQSWEDIKEENPEYTDDDITDTYNDEIDSWIEYEAIYG